MIPADVASRLQVSSDAALRPVAPTQEISDKLAGLVAGQKVLAEIQALLPNGTYRALINQRNVTLALPFSAKAGDSLELQVTETDGKLALAVLSRPGSETKTPQESVSATFSRTGQLISALYSGTQSSTGKDAVLQLSQPIATAPPQTAEDLAPLLKQAITQSGLFYESHQAEWVEGRFPKNALLQEPQGKLSSPEALTQGQEDAANPFGQSKQSATLSDIPSTTNRSGSDISTGNSPEPATKLTTPQTIAPQLQGLVQQQLEALATQNFIWQGQIWPGQDMRWEIDENASQSQRDDQTATSWTTNLRMTLPKLGAIDARLELQGSQIKITVNAGEEGTQALMRSADELLRNNLEAAGLTLMMMGVGALPQENERDEI